MKVEEDCEITVWIGSSDLSLTYSVIGTGGTVELKGEGYRPADPNKTGHKDEWTLQSLDLPQVSPVSVKGDDTIYFIPHPEAKHLVDYWTIDSGSGKQKIYGNSYIDFTKSYGQTVPIYGNTDVQVKFRNYYLLKLSVDSGDKSGTIKITKVMRGGTEVQLPLEMLNETDLQDQPTDRELGYKILDGDVITIKATPDAKYEIKEWNGFGYDDPNTDPEKTKNEREITATGDLDITVSFKKKS